MPEKLLNWYRSTFGHAAAGAALLWAAQPPCNLWPLAWIAPLWWVLLIRRKELRGRRPYRAVYLAGFLYWMATLHWLRLPHPATAFGWLAISFYLGFYLPLFVALARVAVHQLRLPAILAAPVVWTGLELARAYLLTGFSLAGLGHTQYRWIELIQISDLAGALGVSFVVMSVAACLARMLPLEGRPRALWPLVPAGLVLAATLLYGYLRTTDAAGEPHARVALIQGCVDTKMKADTSKGGDISKRYEELSQEALRKHGDVDLIVWPETMFRDPLITFEAGARVPEFFREKKWSPQQFQRALEKEAPKSHETMELLAEKLGVPLILGVDRHHFGPNGMQHFNAAALVGLVGRDGQLLAHYDKMHLVAFGEYVPFAQYFPWLQRLTPLGVNLSEGRSPVMFEMAPLHIAPDICYETVLSRVIRRQVNTLKAQGAEPNVLVNMTNSGWYWGSSELDMHLTCGVFRAVECRKPLLIAANTGFSAHIDADGRILQQGPRRAEDTLLAEVYIDRRHSWYLEHGDWPAGLCLAACAAFAAAGIWRSIARRRGVNIRPTRS